MSLHMNADFFTMLNFYFISEHWGLGFTSFLEIRVKVLVLGVRC